MQVVTNITQSCKDRSFAHLTAQPDRPRGVRHIKISLLVKVFALPARMRWKASRLHFPVTNLRVLVREV
jgi:hypothetical protein